MTRTQALRTGIVWLSFAALALQIALVAYRWDFYQYDFRAYYSGPHLFLTGQDPYSVEAHLAWAKSEGLYNDPIRFIYSPVLLRVFLPFAHMSYPLAFGIWLVFQTIILLAVFRLGVVVLRIPAHWLALCMAFGLNGACAAVIRSGQVTLVILAGLLVFVMLLQKNRLRLGLAVFFLSSSLKIWVLPLVGMGMLPLAWKRIIQVCVCISMIVMVAVAGQVFDPELQARHQAIIGELVRFDSVPAGPSDQSIRNILSYLEEAGIIPAGYRVAIWGGIAAIVTGFTAVVAIRLSLSDLDAERLYTNLFVISSLGLMLVVPRSLIYQWAVAIPSVAFCLSRIQPRPVQIGLAALVLTPTLYINRYIFGISTESQVTNLYYLPWSFWSFTMCALIWGIALKISLDTMRRPASKRLLQPAELPNAVVLADLSGPRGSGPGEGSAGRR